MGALRTGAAPSARMSEPVKWAWRRAENSAAIWLGADTELTVMRRQATPLIMKGFPVAFTLTGRSCPASWPGVFTWLQRYLGSKWGKLGSGPTLTTGTQTRRVPGGVDDYCGCS